MFRRRPAILRRGPSFDKLRMSVSEGFRDSANVLVAFGQVCRFESAVIGIFTRAGVAISALPQRRLPYGIPLRRRDCHAPLAMTAPVKLGAREVQGLCKVD